MVPRRPPKKLKPGETATFAPNPFYDDVLVFAGVTVPTSQDKYKLVDKEKDLYQRISKSNVKEFKKQIQERLLKRKKDWWPFKGEISMVVSISGPKNYIETKDLDNFLKTIFDTMKGIVIADDHKIVSVTVDKNEMPFVSGLLIAIRTEQTNEGYIYGQDSHRWEEDRQLKLSQGGICCMDSY
jgi:Holliday junction resolvase RusA-like endonuclease